MPIQKHLASALDRRDQEPNHQLADRIISGEFSLIDLVSFFKTKPHPDLQKDAILTMAYVAERFPEMMIPHVGFLIKNFNSSINRVVWGSMIALAHVAPHIPKKLYEDLPEVIDAMHSSTVVARDYGFRILVSVYSCELYREDVLLLILEEIQVAPDNQLGQYIERLMPALYNGHISQIKKILEEKRSELSNPYHLRRLEKNLKRL